MKTGDGGPVSQESSWSVGSSVETLFDWRYGEGREGLLALYSKGKQRQWDSDVRIDWSTEVDPENPSQTEDALQINIYGSDVYNRMTERERIELRRHAEGWRTSQFLHGEQGALVCASKIVQTVPDLDSKFYAATQVIDEARHVEVYARYLNEKVGIVYPINPSLKTLLAQVVNDARWDFTYLGMQVLIEGLALAAFSMIRDAAKNPLAASINAYVMQDEARHVAFGRLALRDFYPQLTQREREEREEFVVEACYLMRDRIQGEEIYRRLGLPVEQCTAFSNQSERMRQYRKRLFMRIVPTIRDIGLWGPKVQTAYRDMGVLDLVELDAEAALAQDERIAAEFDARRAHVAETVTRGASV